MSSSTTIGVYGAGNFGYALLKHLDRKRSPGVRVLGFDRDATLLEELRRTRRHSHLHRSIRLTPYVQFVGSAQELAEECDVFVLAVSSEATREVLRSVRTHLRRPVVVLNTAKALDCQSGARLSQVVAEELDGLEHGYAVLAGGTIARDLFRHEPLGVDLASADEEVRLRLGSLLESDSLSVYPTSDLVGVEMAAAFKNVIAVLAGIVKGLGFSYGAETHLISRLADAIGKACVARLGADPDTFGIGSQCWGNDMWMSCTGGSRNRELGVLLGKGYPMHEAVARMGAAHKTVEGLNTVRVLDKVPAVAHIEALRLLHDLTISQSLGVGAIRDYLRRPPGSAA